MSLATVDHNPKAAQPKRDAACADYPRRRLFSFTFWMSIEAVATRLIDGALQIGLLAFLSRSDYGILGVGLGYLALARFFSIQPESALLRYYPQARAAGEGHQIIRCCHAAVSLKAAVAAVLLFLFSGALLLVDTPAVAMACLLLGLTNELRLIQESQSMYLRLVGRNAMIGMLNLISRLFLLIVLISSLLAWPTLVSYLLPAIAFQTAITIAVGVMAVRVLRLPLVCSINDIRAFLPILRDFVFWSHLSVSLLGLIYTLDLLLLHWTGTPINEIGSYSVALRIAAFTFILPMAFQGSTTLAVAQPAAPDAVARHLGIYVRSTFLIALLQVIAFWLCGEDLLKLLLGVRSRASVEEITLVTELSMYLVSAAALLNMLRPFIGHAIAVLPMRRYTFQVAVPATLTALLAFASAAPFGVQAMARANLIAYPALGVFAVLAGVGVRAGIASPFKMTSLEWSVLLRAASLCRKRSLNR